MQELKGVGVAMVTPFDENKHVDYDALERLVRHLHGGADFLVVMGTTGEAVTLTNEEQFAILDFVIGVNEGKLPIVFGIGGNDTQLVASSMAAFDREGVVAFLSASPAYNKPTQEGIYRHYKTLDEFSPLPIILYNVPGRTASNVLPETVSRIVKDTSKIVGIKEAAGDIEQVMALAKSLPEDFLLLSGDDALLLPHMACGGHGVISVVANAFPARFRAVHRHAKNGKFAAAQKEHFALLPLIADLFKEGNPGGVKEALKSLGICDHHMRLPLYPVSTALRDRIAEHVKSLRMKETETTV